MFIDLSIKHLWDHQSFDQYVIRITNRSKHREVIPNDTQQLIKITPWMCLNPAFGAKRLSPLRLLSARAVSAEVRQRLNDDLNKVQWGVQLRQLCDDLKAEAKEDMKNMAKSSPMSPSRKSKSRGRKAEKTKEKKSSKSKGSKKSARKSSSSSSSFAGGLRKVKGEHERKDTVCGVQNKK